MDVTSTCKKMKWYLNKPITTFLYQPSLISSLGCRESCALLQWTCSIKVLASVFGLHFGTNTQDFHPTDRSSQPAWNQASPVISWTCINLTNRHRSLPKSNPFLLSKHHRCFLKSVMDKEYWIKPAVQVKTWQHSFRSCVILHAPIRNPFSLAIFMQFWADHA